MLNFQSLVDILAMESVVDDYEGDADFMKRNAAHIVDEQAPGYRQPSSFFDEDEHEHYTGIDDSDSDSEEEEYDFEARKEGIITDDGDEDTHDGSRTDETS